MHLAMRVASRGEVSTASGGSHIYQYHTATRVTLVSHVSPHVFQYAEAAAGRESDSLRLGRDRVRHRAHTIEIPKHTTDRWQHC